MENRIRYTREHAVIDDSFYRMPKFFFTEEFSALSDVAMRLYSVLRNRLEISIKNGWFNDKGEDMQTATDTFPML